MISSENIFSRRFRAGNSPGHTGVRDHSNPGDSTERVEFRSEEFREYQRPRARPHYHNHHRAGADLRRPEGAAEGGGKGAISTDL